jgi:hypothetical protein
VRRKRDSQFLDCVEPQGVRQTSDGAPVSFLWDYETASLVTHGPCSLEDAQDLFAVQIPCITVITDQAHA